MRLERSMMLDTALEARSCHAWMTVSMLPSLFAWSTFLKLLHRHNSRALENTVNVRSRPNFVFEGSGGEGRDSRERGVKK